MHKLSGLRIAFALVIVGLLLFSLTPNSPTKAQNKPNRTPNTDECGGMVGEPWTEIDASEVDLSGGWTTNQTRKCGPSAKWQVTFGSTITRENNGGYSAKVNPDSTPMTVTVTGSDIVFVRDLTTGAGEDKNGIHIQTWKGKLQRNKRGSLRIYGGWTGAWDYLKLEGYVNDFEMLK